MHTHSHSRAHEHTLVAHTRALRRSQRLKRTVLLNSLVSPSLQLTLSLSHFQCSHHPPPSPPRAPRSSHTTSPRELCTVVVTGFKEHVVSAHGTLSRSCSDARTCVRDTPRQKREHRGNHHAEAITPHHAISHSRRANNMLCSVHMCAHAIR